MESLEKFLFLQASRLEQTAVLVTLAKRFLKDAKILLPADDTLRRITVNQRQAAQREPARSGHRSTADRMMDCSLEAPYGMEN